MTTLDFTSEIHRYEPQLRPFAYNLVRNKEECEDLIQDTFYRALSNKDKFMEGTNIKAWLFTIMKNIFINNYRKNQRWKMVPDISENVYLVNSAQRSIGNEGERVFLSEIIEVALQSVSKDFTEPFMMYFRGFKYEEIAVHLSLPLGTVKSRIFLARKEIRSKLKSFGIEHSQN